MRKAAIVLFLFLCANLFAQEADIRKDVKAVPLSIRQIERYPVLKNGMFACFARVILLEYGREHVSSPLVVQWLYEDPRAGAYAVKYEKIVFQDEAWSLSIDSCEILDDRLKITLSGVHTYSLEERAFTLVVYPDGIFNLVEK